MFNRLILLSYDRFFLYREQVRFQGGLPLRDHRLVLERQLPRIGTKGAEEARPEVHTGLGDH